MPKLYYKGQLNTSMDVLDADVDYWKSQGWQAGAADSQAASPEQVPQPQAQPQQGLDLSQIGAASRPANAPPQQPPPGTTGGMANVVTPEGVDVSGQKAQPPVDDYYATHEIPPPTGSTLITDPAELEGLTEDQIWRQPGTNKIYKKAGLQEPAEMIPGEREALINQYLQAGFSLDEATNRVNELFAGRPEAPAGTERPPELEFAPTGEVVPTTIAEPPTGEAGMGGAGVGVGAPEGGEAGAGAAEAEEELDFIERVNQVLSRYGITPPDPTKDPINQSIEAYRTVYAELGLADIKAQFDEVQGNYADLMEKKDGEIMEIRDNPWMTEGQKQRQIKSIEEKYERKTTNMLNQMAMYENLYQSGQREAQFVMGQMNIQQQQADQYRNIMLQAAIEQVENEMSKTTADITDDMQEYLFAVELGYTGDFVDYKNAVAGRMGGTAGLSSLAQSVIQDPQILTQLTPSVKSEVLSELASAGYDIGEAVRLYGDLTEQQRLFVDKYTTEFSGLSAVKNYQVVAEGYDFVRSIVNKDGQITSTDDQGLIYAFAKAMDPNSVVREGEYATVQKYAQSWAEKFGFDVARVFSNTPFLTAEARANIAETIGTKFAASQRSYDNLFSQYSNRIDNALGQSGSGVGGMYLIDYAAPYREGGGVAGGGTPAPTVTVQGTPQAEGGGVAGGGTPAPTVTVQGTPQAEADRAESYWQRAQAAGVPRYMFENQVKVYDKYDNGEEMLEKWIQARERNAGIEPPKDEAPTGGGEIQTVSIGGRNITASSEITDRIAKADAEMYAATGQHIQVNQSYRTREQQAELYRRSQAGEIGRAAPPGMSYHETGLAIDVTNWREAEPYLRKYGLLNELADDKGHFSYGEFT